MSVAMKFIENEGAQSGCNAEIMKPHTNEVFGSEFILTDR
jgi:hypothetical protein